MAAAPPAEVPPMVIDGKASQSSLPGKKSWVQAAQNKQVLVNHEVKVQVVDGTSMVEILEDLLVDSVPLWDDLLEGRFLEPAPHVAKIHIIVNKIWPLGNNNIKVDVFAVNETTVKFRIRDEQTRRRVLKSRMWNIAGIPMILSKWAPMEVEEETETKIIPMWVTLKNVPHRMYSWKGLGFIASSVGKPVWLHPETELCTNNEEAKVFVNANMTKELRKVYRFKSKQGIDPAVEFFYPWLPTKCSLCSRWGHAENDCSKRREKEVAGDSNLKVGVKGKDIVEKDLSPKESPRESETERRKADAVEIMDTPADLVDTPARIGDDVEHVENSVDCTGEELVVASQSDLAKSPDANSWSLVSLGKTGR